MVFWRHNEAISTSFDEIAKQAYSIMNIFNNHLPKEFRPNYLTVNKKQDAKPYDWNYQTFYNDLYKNVNHTKERVFKELGYSLSFFSSLENANSFGYMIHVGATDPRFTNSIVVNLAFYYNYFDEKACKTLEKIFYECVRSFGAYYACVANSSSILNNGLYLTDEGVPTSLHWLNYWSPEIMKKIDRKRVKKLEQKYKEFVFNDGFLKLQNVALDANSEQDVEYKKALEESIF